MADFGGNLTARKDDFRITFLASLMLRKSIRYAQPSKSFPDFMDITSFRAVSADRVGSYVVLMRQ
jgi:hypothetical protein